MREKTKIQILQNMLEEVTKKYDYFIEQQHKEMEHTFEMAIRDQLTGLYNRQYLFEYSKQAFDKINRHDGTMILIFIDLDNFKHVNDHYGHEEGDNVLRKIGDIFRKTFRNYDIVVRYGGDEFIVFIEDKRYSTGELSSMLDSFVQRVEDTLFEFKVSASYGLAMAPNEAKDLKKLIELADERMYVQKRIKKNSR